MFVFGRNAVHTEIGRNRSRQQQSSTQESLHGVDIVDVDVEIPVFELFEDIFPVLDMPASEAVTPQETNASSRSFACWEHSKSRMPTDRY